MKPNIIIRSNVFIRSSIDIIKDSNFLLQVRGRKALVSVLRRISPSTDLQSAARAHLSQRQVAQVAWEVPCADCGEFPEGAVKRAGKEEIEFRCPKLRCPSRHMVGRRVLLDPELVEQVISSLGDPLSEIVAVALAGYEKSTTGPPALASSRRPYTIRLTASQYYFFSDGDIETALKRLVGERT